MRKRLPHYDLAATSILVAFFLQTYIFIMGKFNEQDIKDLCLILQDYKEYQKLNICAVDISDSSEYDKIEKRERYESTIEKCERLISKMSI